MTVTNTGAVMADWSFVPKNDETSICKSWLRFSPMDGILAPNESADIEVTIHLNQATAYEIISTNSNVIKTLYFIIYEFIKYY